MDTSWFKLVPWCGGNFALISVWWSDVILENIICKHIHIFINKVSCLTLLSWQSKVTKINMWLQWFIGCLYSEFLGFWCFNMICNLVYLHNLICHDSFSEKKCKSTFNGSAWVSNAEVVKKKKIHMNLIIRMQSSQRHFDFSFSVSYLLI